MAIPQYGGEQFGHRADQYLPPGSWQGVPGGFGGQLFTPNNPALGTDRGFGSDPRVIQAPDSYGNQFRAQWAPAATDRFAAGNWDPGRNPDEWDAGRAARLQKRNAGYIAQGGPAPVPPGYPGVPLGPGNTGGQFNPVASQLSQAMQGSQQAQRGQTGQALEYAGMMGGQPQAQMPGGGGNTGRFAISQQGGQWGMGSGPGGEFTAFDSPGDDFQKFGSSLTSRGDQGANLRNFVDISGRTGSNNATARLNLDQAGFRDQWNTYSPQDQQMLQNYIGGFNQRWGGGQQAQPQASAMGARQDAGALPPGSGASRMQRFTNVANRQAQKPTARGQNRLGNMLGAQIQDTMAGMQQAQQGYGGGYSEQGYNPNARPMRPMVQGGAPLGYDSGFDPARWTGPPMGGGFGGFGMPQRSPFMGGMQGGYNPNARPMRPMAMGGAPMGYDAGFDPARWNPGY